MNRFSEWSAVLKMVRSGFSVRTAGLVRTAEMGLMCGLTAPPPGRQIASKFDSGLFDTAPGHSVKEGANGRVTATLESGKIGLVRSALPLGTSGPQCTKVVRRPDGIRPADHPLNRFTVLALLKWG